MNPSSASASKHRLSVLLEHRIANETQGLEVDLYYPALPKPRADQILMIEVLLSSGTDTDRKTGLVAARRRFC
jgi:hypothetical protein